MESIRRHKELYFLLFKFLNHSSDLLRQAIWGFLEVIPSPAPLIESILAEVARLEELGPERLVLPRAKGALQQKAKVLATFNNRRFSFDNEVDFAEPLERSFEQSPNAFSEECLFEFGFSEILVDVSEANLYKLSVLKVRLSRSCWATPPPIRSSTSKPRRGSKRPFCWPGGRACSTAVWWR